MTEPVKVLWDKARRAVTARTLVEARSLFVQALSATSTTDADVRALLAELRATLITMGDQRGALTIDWFTEDRRGAEALLDAVPAVDAGRTLIAWADAAKATNGGEPDAATRRLYAQAAERYEAAGLLAQAAIAREKGEDFAEARLSWSRLAERMRGASRANDLYAAGLAHFNVARTSKRTGDRASVRPAIVSAVHRLEQAADLYESQGQRERSFDCYQVLAAVGRESGEFEHVLEGSLNVIRIVREDLLRYYAVQTYEEIIAASERQGEPSAAATLARELCAYARKEGLSSVENFARLAQARLWRQVADKAIERGLRANIAENALLAAIVASAEAGQYGDVGDLYASLAALPLEPARCAHYKRASARYVGVGNAAIDAGPLAEQLRQQVGYPEVWHDDLLEWEQRGSASEACADIIFAQGSWSEVMRKRALVARLQAIEVETSMSSSEATAPAVMSSLLEGLAGALAVVESYAILSPLERLFERKEAAVRQAVVRALGRFLFKRSFTTLRIALLDEDTNVVLEAARSLENMRFSHAFDPLTRIYRESGQAEVRASVLRALARIDTAEVAEVLLGVIEHEAAAERDVVLEALGQSRAAKFLELVRRELPHLPESTRSVLRRHFSQRNVTL